jgi:hypothetical protein
LANDENACHIQPIYVLGPRPKPNGNDPDAWRPWHLFSRTTVNRHKSLVCTKIFKTSENKMSNIMDHIKPEHFQLLPINWWTSKQITEEHNSWTNRRIKRKNTFQSTLSYAGKSIKEQNKMWTKAVILGNLPLSVENNYGLREIIKFYNKDSYPKGISYFKYFRSNIKFN